MAAAWAGGVPAPPAAPPSEKALAEACDEILEGGAARALSVGMQCGAFFWSYVAPAIRDADAATPFDQLVNPEEVKMSVALARYYVSQRVPAERVLVVSLSPAHSRAVQNALAKDADVAAVQARFVTQSTGFLVQPFDCLVVNAVGVGGLDARYSGVEGDLTALLLAAARGAKGSRVVVDPTGGGGAPPTKSVVFMGSTQFVREARCGIPQPWKSKWGALAAKFAAAPFTLSGGSEELPGRVGPSLPLCCPRHPSVRASGTLEDGVPRAFCPYPCLARYAGCAHANHVCTKPCHACQCDHTKCPYPNSRRLPCGHQNITLCSEPEDCGHTTTVAMPCSHRIIKGWDELKLKIVYGCEKHTMTLKCGEKKTAEEMVCKHPTVVVCRVCGADREVACHERVPRAELEARQRDRDGAGLYDETPAPAPGASEDDDEWAVDDEAAGECPHCYTLRAAIWSSIRVGKLSTREAARQQKGQDSLQLRLAQVAASKKGIFVEGQRVSLTDPSLCEVPQPYEASFGERQWWSNGAAPPVGTQGMVRARTSHNTALSKMVYLVETQGQEHFVVQGKGLVLCSVVEDLQGGANVLLITGASLELTPGEWRIYTGDAKTNVFAADGFEGVREVLSYCGTAAVADKTAHFYTPENLPKTGAVFRVEAKFPHPDGCGVAVHLLRDISQGDATPLRFLLCDKGGSWRTPLQKQAKVLATPPPNAVPSAPFRSLLPDVKGWYDGRVAANDTGVIKHVLADPDDAKQYYYVVRLDVRRAHAVFRYRGVEFDEEADRKMKEDRELETAIEREAEDVWALQQPTAKAAYQQQRVKEARHREERAATLAALSAKRKAESKKVLTAAERAKRDAGFARARDDATRKRKRLDREEDTRTLLDGKRLKLSLAAAAVDTPAPAVAPAPAAATAAAPLLDAADLAACLPDDDDEGTFISRATTTRPPAPSPPPPAPPSPTPPPPRVPSSAPPEPLPSASPPAAHNPALQQTASLANQQTYTPQPMHVGQMGGYAVHGHHAMHGMPAHPPAGAYGMPQAMHPMHHHHHHHHHQHHHHHHHYPHW